MATLEELINSMYDMVQDAKGIPLAGEKCIIERDHLLDLLEEEKWELKPAAERCGISATALVKRLARDPELWSFANQERQRFGHCPLRRP